MIRKHGSAEEVEQFWSDLEIELGESIRAYALAEHLSGWSIPKTGRWLIAFVTASAVHFRRPARNNWLGGVFGISSSGDEEMEYHIPSGRLLAVEDAGKGRSGVRRWPGLLGRDPGVTLRYRDEHGRDKAAVFRFDTNRKEIIAALEAIIHIPE